MRNPLHDLIDWLKALDQETQLDIAFMTYSYHPGFDYRSIPDTEHLIEEFYAKFDEYLDPPLNSNGFLIAFRGIFEFIFIARRSTPEAWENTKKINQSVLDDVDKKYTDGMKQFATTWLNDLPNKIDKWGKISQSWNVLKNGAISDQTLEQWEHQNLIELSKPKNPTVIRVPK